MPKSCRKYKSDDVYKIEKILAEKKENGKVKVLVK